MSDISLEQRIRETAEAIIKRGRMDTMQSIGSRSSAGSCHHYVIRLDTEAIVAMAQAWLDGRQASSASPPNHPYPNQYN
jgi:hypothetical protein